MMLDRPARCVARWGRREGETEMWITEIHHHKTGALIARVRHGASHRVAMDAHNSYMFTHAAHRVHLIWEEAA
jgi:hypothetical protein